MSPFVRACLSFATVGAVLVGTGATSGAQGKGLTLSSSKFTNGGEIPDRYTCKGNNLSPPLAFENVPAGAKTLALVVDDPDASEPPQHGFTHWVVFDIPATARGIKEGAKKDADFPRGTREGVNDAQMHGYSAPCPRAGTHHYQFKLYALDDRIDRQGLTRIELENSMRGHVLAQTELVGVFHK
jgi:Raf kinase inhibitor-like YbhB/YbcL family protein